jgi:hypothetical protein
MVLENGKIPIRRAAERKQRDRPASDDIIIYGGRWLSSGRQMAGRLAL